MGDNNDTRKQRPQDFVSLSVGQARLVGVSVVKIQDFLPEILKVHLRDFFSL